MYFSEPEVCVIYAALDTHKDELIEYKRTLPAEHKDCIAIDKNIAVCNTLIAKMGRSWLRTAWI